jgi:N6-adenosine-specific RNA methylase IME4
MSKTKRGASSNYKTLTNEDLKNLPVEEICEDDAILVLWVPSTLLSEGLEVMKAWGFRQTQTHIWVKTKKFPLKLLYKKILQSMKVVSKTGISQFVKDILSESSLDDSLAFGMGRLFRQTHELALVGVRGKIYNHLENKSQRSVHFFPATKHSVKPEILQDRLDIMFKEGNRLELFARRNREGWTCLGLECPSTIGEDIRDSLNRLRNHENIIAR